MENLIFLLTASWMLYKPSKKIRRIAIGNINSSVLFFSKLSFDFTQTEEGDKLCFAEHAEKKLSYGILYAQINTRLSLDEAEEVMINYLNRLRKPFHALYSTGIALSRNFKKKDYCIQIEDYWQDANGLDWKIKSYTNGKSIAILYVKNISEISVNKQDLFLDSFRFE